MNQHLSLGSFTLLLFCFFLFPSSTHAVTLSPVRVELSGDPGQTLAGEIEVLNEESAQKVFYTSFENFEPGGEDGSPHFVGGSKGLATWIDIPESITLGPNEKRVVPFTVTIPTEIESGGYFAAIFLGTQSGEQLNGGEVSVGGRLGVLILLTVRGDILEAAGISSFSAEGGRLHAAVPLTFAYRIKNDGGDRIVPAGDITITNTFGFESAVLPANERNGSVLPMSTRRFQVLWGSGSIPDTFWGALQHEWNNLHFGWYTAHARIAWGDQNSVSVARYDFFLIPWQLLIVFLGVLGMSAFILKRYNAWIIARAQRS